MRILFLSLLFLLPSIGAGQCLQANIVILLDWSGSEIGNEHRLASSTMAFAADLPINERAVHLEVITFSSWAEKVVDMSYDLPYIESGIMSMTCRRAGGGTEIRGSLNIAMADLIRNDRNVRNIIIIISDGDIEDMEEAEKNFKAVSSEFPIYMYAVQIYDENEAEEYIKGYYNLVKFTGDKDYVTRSTSSGLVKALKNLDYCN